MPSISSSLFKAKSSKGEIQSIMNNHQISYPQAKVIDYFFNRFATPIHKGQWLSKDDLLRMNPPCSVKGFGTFDTDRNMVDFGKTIHYLKSNIMPGHLILNSRIPKSYDDLHIQLFFFLLLLLFLYLSSFSNFWSHCFYNLLLHHRWHDRR